MRDDLHKNAPVPKKHKTFMRKCAKESEWGEGTRRAAADAIISELCGEIGSRFLSSLVQFASDPQNSLPGVDRFPFSPVEIGGKGTLLEQQVLAHLQRRFSVGNKNESAVEDALVDTINGLIDSRFRQYATHWRQQTNDRDYQTLCARALNDLQSLPINEIAEQLVNHADVRALIPNLPPYDVDADIRGIVKDR